MFFLSVSLCCASLTAQTPDKANLEATVSDSSHAPVVRTHMIVKNQLTGLVRSVDSNPGGHLMVAGLPIAGLYSITIAAPGFTTAHTSKP